MGSVWRVFDNTLLRTVACKMLHKEKVTDANERENFLVEGPNQCATSTPRYRTHL